MPHATYTYAPAESAQGWLRRAKTWLDDKGKGAWIAVMVLSFIFVWPVGLALLAYMIWSKRMFACKHRPHHGPRGRHMHRARAYTAHAAARPSGNSAFDAYKEETLRRLQDEQEQFETFLERLRAAKDKAEFDQFMEDRAKRAAEGHNTAEVETPDAGKTEGA